MSGRLVYDLETDGLLYEPWELDEKSTPVTKVHCLVVKDVDTGAVEIYMNARPDGLPKDSHWHGLVADGVKRLQGAAMRIGHNILNYDDRVLAKLYPNLPLPQDHAKIRDTQVCARVCWPDEHLKHLDFIKAEVLKKRPNGPQFPKKLKHGAHSLKAWGWRLGLSKETAFDYETADYSKFTKETLGQCLRDVDITDLLFKKLEERRVKHKRVTNRAFELEQQFAQHLRQQERNGVAFDLPKALKLTANLVSRRAEVDALLREEFPAWTVVSYTPKKKLRREKTVYFNPQSDRHVAKVLVERGWRPTKFNQDGSPSVAEEVLRTIDVKGIELIKERAMLGMRLGQIAEGKNKSSTPWLKCVKPDGRIHGIINHNAAVTSRCTHRRPNMSAVPRLIDNYGKPTPFGRECRELFYALPGMKLVGGDAKGLELRMLAHFMAEYDAGEYANVVVNGDPHSMNAAAAGLSSREQAKRFIYAFLYGAGDAKIAAVLGCPLAEAKKVRKRFLKNLPALARLKADLNRMVMQYGMVPTLDGRWLHVRSGYAALNTLMQGSGAIVLKMTSIAYPKILLEKYGLQHGEDYKQVLFSHDEIQIETPELHVEPIRGALAEAVVKAGERLKVRCPLAFDTKVGQNWSDTH